MSEAAMLRLLITMSGLLIEAIKMVESAKEDASKADRDDAINRLALTAEEVKQRLEDM